jgi:hypothetical protein
MNTTPKKRLLDPLVGRATGVPVSYTQTAEGYYRVHVTDWASAARHARARRAANAEVSDGGPLTHESKQARTRRSLH